MSATDSVIVTLPDGSFHTAGSSRTLRADGRHHFIVPCLEDVPHGAGHCFRPKTHEGRHAFIATSGRVWAVWGDDEHKAARERSRSGGAA